MCEKFNIISSVVILSLSLVHLNLVEGGDDWDGMLCFSGNQASAKFCKSCVTVYNNYSLLKRDCFDSLSPKEQQDCKTGTNVECIECSTPFCNVGHPKHRCYVCDSETDEKCFDDELDQWSNQCLLNSNELDDFYCYTKWDKKTGGIQRGCVTNTTEYSSCLHDKTGCKLCLSTQGNGICNIGEFPKNRRKCIRCNKTSRMRAL